MKSELHNGSTLSQLDSLVTKVTKQSKVTHTPGPWQVISGPDGYSPAIATSDEALAITLAHGFHNEQDAAICAAAPDMLEALEAVNGWATNGKGYAGLPLSQIRAAIAKAKGGE